LIIPWAISFIIVGFSLFYGFYGYVGSFGQLLNSVITFASILLGFLSTLLGILITIRNSPIMKKLYEEGYRIFIKYYFYEAITAGFLVVITSMVLQVVSVDIVFYLWFFLVTLFVLSAFRLISTLMGIMFKSHYDDEDEVEDDSEGNKDKCVVKLPENSSLPMVNKEKKDNRAKGQTIINNE
jgi:hypothetical protein